VLTPNLYRKIDSERLGAGRLQPSVATHSGPSTWKTLKDQIVSVRSALLY
jgi:hypothetical protein